MLAGWLLGFLSTRSALRTKYIRNGLKHEGRLKPVYDPDNPSHPPMALEIGSLHYILTHDEILLSIEKRNFPSRKPKEDAPA